MKPQLVKAVMAANVVKEIQPLLDQGYKITHCVAEVVAATDSSMPGTYAARGHHEVCGLIVIVMEFDMNRAYSDLQIQTIRSRRV